MIKINYDVCVHIVCVIGISVPDKEVKFLADIADVLPVAYLLPTTSGPGLCSLALSDFLLFQQNELLEFCQNSSKYSGSVENQAMYKYRIAGNIRGTKFSRISRFA